MSKVPSWFILGVVIVGSAVAIGYFTAGMKIVVEVKPKNKSMRPAIGERDSFTVRPIGAAVLRRGSIIAFRAPGTARAQLGRLVALGGDRIRVESGTLYVNGKPSKSTKQNLGAYAPEFICPRSCVYVLFDRSRGSMKDSSAFGPLPMWRVLGTPVL